MRGGVGRAGSPSRSSGPFAHPAARAFGWAAWLAGLVLPATACFCSPGPSGPPAQATCDPSGMTYEGVTRVAVTSVQMVFGAQGGSHTEVRFSAFGTTLPDCAAYRLYVGDAPSTSGTIRGAVSGGAFESRAIILLAGGVRPYSVEVFGLRSAPFGAPPDAGSADGGPEDAGPEDAALDASSDAAGETPSDGGGEADASGSDGG